MRLQIGKASDCSPSWGSLSKLTIVHIGEEVGPMDHSVYTLHNEACWVLLPQRGLLFSWPVGNKQTCDSKAILIAFALNPPFYHLAFKHELLILIPTWKMVF